MLFTEAKMARAGLTSLESIMASGKGLKTGEEATPSCSQDMQEGPVLSLSYSKEILETMPSFQVLQGITGSWVPRVIDLGPMRASVSSRVQ